MSKFLYPIKNLNVETWIKYWLEKRANDFENRYVLSEILTGTSFYLTDSVNKKFNMFGITGNTTQESTTGKNLFNENQLLQADGWTVSNGIYSGVINDWFIAFKNGFSGLTFNENTQYTISFKGYTTGGTPRIKILYTDDTSSTLNFNATTMTAYSFTSPAGKTISKVQADYGAAGQNTIYLTEFQIEQGSTVTSYEPYTGGQASPNPSYPQDIKNTGDSGTINEKVQNKNILNPGEFAQKVIDSPYNSSNVSTYDSETGALVIKMGDGSEVFTNFKENTQYTFLIKYELTGSPSTRNLNLALVYDDDTIQNFAPNQDLGLYKFVSSSNKTIKYIKHIASTGSGTRTLYLKESGIFEGVLAESDFVAHAEQNISFPLSQGQKLMEGDYLADDGVHHVRGQVVLDGTEGWGENGSNQGYKVTLNNVGGNSSQTVISNILCDRLRAVAQANIYQGNVDNGVASLGGTTKAIYVRFDETITSVALLRQKLADNPITVQYELATEVIDPYTEEQAEVWEQIKALRTYKPVTHISSEDETPAILQIQYWKEKSNETNN